MHIIRAMRSRFTLLLTVALLADAGHRRNPVIDLLEQHQSVFGLYAPSNGGRRGEPTTSRPASELAKDALAFKNADFLFNGSMEGGVDRGLGAATDFVTSEMFRTWAVRFDAMKFTESVRSFHVPATPCTSAWPPSLPSVPTSRATRVTSASPILTS